MSIIMSCVVTWVNTGFFYRYFNAFTFAFPVAIIAAFIMGPIAKAVVSRIATKD